ncbi:ABC transporter ATP-binding protein [Paenibacillus rhizophilus]|uniref:ATP-binding cassette domain-containing protein n=1 Tax=Paenibacillus rhizophilus TaxID=1850366 RepID=A0A3N9PB72_9BACL|nr:ATP-binding cassette domain-containing protein [Paenibacillus rhizophilus]RQW13513.1 ATP-binding cassette domain-containing protein [Paenibacillus rhizophilus]
MSALFEIHNLAKHNWDNGDQASKYIFSQLSAEITEPERIALIGASGQGKSTLLRILALLDTPDEGDLLLDGASYKNTNVRLWRMGVSYVAQQAVMLPGSVEDNLRMVSKLHGLAYDSVLAAQLLKQLGLDYLDLGKQAADCSGGEKQRISLIRSLLLRPRILLLDEITASLDINSTQKVEELLMDWHLKEETLLIWVTHDLEQARRISNRTWVMGRGELQDHSSDSFFAEPVAVLAQKFIQPVKGSL